MKKYGILLVMFCFVVFQMTWSQSHKKSLPRPDGNICWYVIDDMPVYPGGTVALRQWMIDSVAPGLDSIKSSAEGKLLISFVVLENGACDSFKVVKSVAPEIDTFFLNGLKKMRRWTHGKYGAQNEAYRMMEGRKIGKVVSLQRVMRSLMVEAPQNETFTLV